MRRHLVPHRHPGHRPAPGWSNLVWRICVQTSRLFFQPSRFGFPFFFFSLWDLLAIAGLVQVIRWASFASETFLGEPLFVFFAKSCIEGDPCPLVGPEDASSHFSNYYFAGVRLVDLLGPRGWVQRNHWIHSGRPALGAKTRRQRSKDET